ncbi:MAG: pterin-4-alpha-carbinolamine dehydratase [Alphaproteobacteria bacterium]|nr:pterin-4-alpha-carbinolamine dehydratase [Alphaproteobacteria bacterium]
MSLTAKTCVPCQGGIPPLTRVEAEHFLKEVPEWALSEDGVWIERQLSFDDFAMAQAFVNKVGELAEEEGHHPDITFGWGYAKVVFYTHKIKGLHENDFIMAAKVDQFS